MEPTQDNAAITPAATPASAAKPQSKFRRIVWGIGGLIAIAVGATQLYSAFQGVLFLPGCDSQNAKDTLSGIFKEHKFEPTGYDSIKTISSSKDEVVCNAVLPLPDGANLIADYNFFWEGKTVKVKYSMHRKAP
jgi:hypothetical protein